MQEFLAVVQESGAGFVSGKGVGSAYHSTNRPLFHSRIAPFALRHGAGLDDVIPVLRHPSIHAGILDCHLLAELDDSHIDLGLTKVLFLHHL